MEMSQDSDSTYATDCSASYVSSPVNSHYLPSSSYSASPPYSPPCSVQSPEPSKNGSAEVLNNATSPVFKSEAARQIIKEMAEKKPESGAAKLKKRQVPREKRRHYTVSSSQPNVDLQDAFAKMVVTRPISLTSLSYLSLFFFGFFSFV